MNEHETIERLTKERDDALAKLRREVIAHHDAAAKVAEMRVVIGDSNELLNSNAVHGEAREQADAQIRDNLAALSSDRGKGWKSPEEYAALRNALERIAEYWNQSYNSAVDAAEECRAIALEALTKGAVK